MTEANKTLFVFFSDVWNWSFDGSEYQWYWQSDPNGRMLKLVIRKRDGSEIIQIYGNYATREDVNITPAGNDIS